MNYKRLQSKARAAALSVAFLSFISFATLSSVAQEDPWATIYQQGYKALQSGDYVQSEKLMNQALDLAKSFPSGDIRYLSSLEAVAITQTFSKKYADAEQTYKKVLAIKTKRYADTSLEVATTRANLANLCFYENKYKQADSLYSAALKNLTPDSLMALEALQNLGVCQISEGKYADAEASLESAVLKNTATNGAQSIQVIGARLSLAQLAESVGDYKASLERCKALYAELDGLKLDPHLKTSCLSVIAACQQQLAQYTDAEATDKKILDMTEARDGKQSEDYARGLQRLGQLYVATYKYKDAESLFLKAKEVIDKNFPKLPYQSDLLLDMAKLHIALGHYDKAEGFLNRCLDIRKEAYGPRHSDVAECLVELAYVKAQKNKASEAEDLYKEALSIEDETVGQVHPQYAKLLSRLGQLYASEHRRAEAENNLSEALRLRETNLPAGHPDIAQSMNDLANFYKENGSPEKAESIYRRLITVDDQFSKENEAVKIADLQNLQSTLKAQGKGDLAGDIARNADTLMKKLPGYKAQKSVEVIAAEQSALKVISAPVANKWALCVGISNFQDTSINLKYAAKDATDFSNFLVAKGNFAADHVKLLTDENANRESILGQLGPKWLQNKVGKDDLVVIYISSHGSQPMEEANNTNFLVAYDTNKNALLSTGIPMQWLSQIIKEQVPSNRILVILDVCHSGAAVEAGKANITKVGQTNAGADAGAKGLIRGTVDASTLPAGAGQIVVCSSSSDQVSWESKEYPNSVFTRRLMQALESQGTATSLSDAYKLMKSKVQDEVLRDRQTLQTPGLKETWKGSSLKPLAINTNY